MNKFFTQDGERRGAGRVVAREAQRLQEYGSLHAFGRLKEPHEVLGIHEPVRDDEALACLSGVRRDVESLSGTDVLPSATVLLFLKRRAILAVGVQDHEGRSLHGRLLTNRLNQACDRAGLA